MLELDNVSAGYGDGLAIRDVSLTVNAGEGVALLGRNGAGKSTTIKTVMGLIRPTAGRIRLRDGRLDGLAPDAVARLGIGYVPEDRRIFSDLGVAENLETGAKPGPDGDRTWTAARVFELFPEIARRRDRPAGTLSGGERQMLAVARALMGNPSLLLLDEPSEGLAPVVVARLGDALAALRAEGMAMLISEQNRALAARIAGRAVLLETGAVVFSGRFAELAADQALLERHLGV